MLVAAFRLADRFRRPLSELDITWNEFCYWQAFLIGEQNEDFKPEPNKQSMEDQLAFMRGLSNG